MVPIKDPSLIGRKIDCPKCKYRFVVEEPAPEEDADEDEPQSAQKVGTKRAGGKAAPTRPASLAKPKPKSAGMSSTVKIGIVLGVVAVIALGVGGVFLLGNKDKGGSSGGSSGVSGRPGGEDEAQTKTTGTQLAANQAPFDITELLPNDSQAVFSVQKPSTQLDEVGPVGIALFRTFGAFRPDLVEHALGIRVADMARVVRAQGLKDGKPWSFNVLRLTKEADPSMVFKALGVDPERDGNKTTKGYTYYMVKSNDLMDGLTSLVRGKPDRKPSQGEAAPAASPLALYIYDDYKTLVFAGKEPLEKLLDEGKPTVIYEAPAAPPPAPKAAPPDGQKGGDDGAGRRSSAQLPSESWSGAGDYAIFQTDARPGRGGRPGMRPGGGDDDMGPGPGMGRRGRFGPPGQVDQPGDVPQPDLTPEGPPSYITVQPPLKALLDLVEGKRPAVFSAASLEGGYDLFKRVERATTLDLSIFLPENKEQLATVKNVAVALRSVSTKNVTFAVALQYDSADSALAAHKFLLETQKPILAKKIENTVDIKITDPPKPEDLANDPNAPFGPGVNPRFPIEPGMGPGPGGPGPGGFRGGRGGRFGRGDMLEPGMGPGPGGMRGGLGSPAGGFPGTPPPTNEPPPEPPSTITVSASGDIVLVTVDLVIDKKLAKLLPILQSAAIRAKGIASMATGRQALHDLADAVWAYVSEKNNSNKPEDKKFPQAALPREAGPDRIGVPFAPRERVSWLIELLPYLPGGDFQELRLSDYGKRRLEELKQKSWREGDTWFLAQAAIPGLLVDADAAEKSWYVSYPELPAPLATTHFVGVSGIGLDIVDEPASKDPAVLKRMGILGNERETKFDDIKGGLGKTILMIQVPIALNLEPGKEAPVLQLSPEGPWRTGTEAAKDKASRFVYRTPWLAGGGTVRGVPEKNSLDPFVCVEYQGKPGTFAIMADGTVRFLAKGGITDKQFQDLCTLQGNKPDDDTLEAIAPKVYSPQEKKAELRTGTLPGTTDLKTEEKSGVPTPAPVAKPPEEKTPPPAPPAKEGPDKK
jgi:hypothetical protein